MNPVGNKVVSGESAPSGRLAETIAHYTETMSAVERLCLQSGGTLVALGRSNNEGFYSFARKMMVWTDTKAHPTTSAQCISAIQDLLRALDGIKLTQPEPANLPFQPLAKGRVDKESLKKLREDLQGTLKKQMEVLADTQLAKSADVSADADWFGELNPFTCAQTFRALAPSAHLISAGCWTSLFGILWALQRKYPTFDGSSGVAMPHSLPTAFVTSHCIDAIGSLVETLGRREERLKRLIKLIEGLEDLDKATLEKDYARRGLKHRQRSLCDQIKTSLDEIVQDTPVKALFELWVEKIRKPENPERKKPFSANDLQGAFIAAFQECKESEIDRKLNIIAVTLTNLENGVVKPICSVANWFKSESLTGCPYLSRLPDGVVERRYREATNKYFSEPSSMPKSVEEQLKKYWTDHLDAAKGALTGCQGLQEFLIDVVGCYAGVSINKVLSAQLTCATNLLTQQREKLHELLRGAVNWSEGVMDHQLAVFRSAKMGEFDAAELAHAARTVSRTGASKHAAGVLQSIDAICNSQNPDGNWPSSQPFFWTHGGVAAFPHSAEVAWALVSIMRTVMQNPETYGLGQSEALARLDSGNQTLRRYLGWISATAHTYPLPELLCKTGDTNEPPQVFGWSSDRTPEPDLVHAWATANVVEFLIEFRDLLQVQINTALRIEFLSYHPSDLPQLKNFPTPDLKKKYKKRIGTWLRLQLQMHIERAKRETHWIPGAKYGNEDLNFFSAILAGPPGSAKSYLAKCIAGELGWPLIAFSPSDFLSAGEANVEARAREIFDSLNSGSRVVYFFDEIDELIVDRAHTQREQGRSVFSFLTPSFLTKLQDLHDAAKRKGFLFLIGTNYLDRIDSAAKRPGRIDETKLILYPDSESRTARIFERLREEFKPKKKDANKESEELNNFLTKLKSHGHLDSIVGATTLSLIPALDLVCKETFSEYSKNKNRTAFWAGFKKKINKLRKRDVNLSVYMGRPDAVDEWCQMMDLVPEEYEKGRFHAEQLEEYLGSLTDRWHLHGARVKKQINAYKAPWLTGALKKIVKGYPRNSSKPQTKGRLAKR